VEWHRQNPNQHNVAATRLTEFVNTLPQAAATSRRQNPGSVFSLLYLNPLAGLDPTTRAIEQTRYLAERGMFYAQRAPTLLGWQVELTTYQLAAEPETRQVLTNLNEVAQSTTVFAQTAEGLPKLVNEQREAAINQLLAGVAHERSNILVTLSAQEAQLRELLPQVRQTLTAGGDMANSVNGAVKSLDAFVRYVSPPETNSPPPDTNSPPFNILDYGKAASQIEAMAKEINTLLTSVNQSVPQLTRVTEQATVNAKEVVNHAFRLGLVLILVFLVGAVLAGLAWRFLTRERRPRAGKSGSA